MDLRVLPGNLVSREWEPSRFPKVTENVQARPGRFHHQCIGAFLLIQEGVAKNGALIGRIGLVGALIQGAGAGGLSTADRIPERTVKGGGELGSVGKNAGGGESGGVEG